MQAPCGCRGALLASGLPGCAWAVTRTCHRGAAPTPFPRGSSLVSVLPPQVPSPLLASLEALLPRSQAPSLGHSLRTAFSGGLAQPSPSENCSIVWSSRDPPVVPRPLSAASSLQAWLVPTCLPRVAGSEVRAGCRPVLLCHHHRGGSTPGWAWGESAEQDCHVPRVTRHSGWTEGRPASWARVCLADSSPGW